MFEKEKYNLHFRRVIKRNSMRYTEKKKNVHSRKSFSSNCEQILNKQINNRCKYWSVWLKWS